MKVIKRNGTIINFDEYRIINAIEKAMIETKNGIDEELSKSIANKISKQKFDVIKVEQIQDMVEELLMDTNRKDVAKSYILYRNSRDKARNNNKTTGLLTEEFLSKYKHQPSPMNQLGNFVYYRTYSRWLQEEQRREYWWETVKRAVEYNCSLVPTSRDEAEKLYDNIFNLRQFLSGRTLYIGGTLVSEKFPTSNYNCSFSVVDNFEVFKDAFYLLMIGSGFGFRILKSDVSKLPRVKTNVEIIHKEYISIPKDKREDNTSIQFVNNNMIKIIVGDSKGGWVQALDYLLKMLWDKDFIDIKTIIFIYDHVRPKGERLKTFGGTASGYESLKSMFSKVDKIIKKEGINKNKERIKLRPINCLDILNAIGENVVIGGVRRTSEIALINSDDEECIKAKSNLYKQTANGEWEIDTEMTHRQMSNNSIYYKEKPSREQIHWQIEQMRYSGEPAFVNEIAGNKRRPNFNGVNPCAEILLDSNGLCNLTTVNVFAFVKDNKLDLQALLEAQKLSARSGYRMTCVELELPKWDAIQQRDKLTGCSLTGWQDMVNSTGISKNEEAELLRKLRQTAHEEIEKYSQKLGLPTSLLITTVKPEGTLSQIPGVTSGIHYSESDWFIRRVRINAHDPLVKVCEELNYPIFPEVGQTMENCTTKVIEFPMKSINGRTKYDVSAIEQLENYKMFMDNYVDHNASITITVRDNEWDGVEEWVFNNWDDIVAVSFLSLTDSFYQLMPYEAITEEEYNKKVKEMKPFIPSLISKYEKVETEFDIGNDECVSGACPIR